MMARRSVFEARDLSIGHTPGVWRSIAHAKVLAARVCLRVEQGQALVVLGPNGAGKTTLLRTLLGVIPALSGQVLYDGARWDRLDWRQRARLVAYVPQVAPLSFDYRVRDVVVMGRAAHLSTFASPSKHDLALAEGALETMGVAHLADALESELSGGERQLVQIARALAQQSKFLILDEPTASLDVGSQARVVRCIRGLVQSGLGVIMNTHAPSHAAACGTHVALLDRHGRFEVGTVAEMFTEHRLTSVYGVPVHVVCVPRGDRLLSTCLADPGGS